MRAPKANPAALASANVLKREDNFLVLEAGLLQDKNKTKWIRLLLCCCHAHVRYPGTTMKIKSIKVVFETGFPVILISGTPGTGKSTIIKKAQSKNASLQVLNISDFVKSKGLHDGYDKEFDTFIINDRKTQKELMKSIPKMRRKGPVLIECHSCGLFDEDEMESLVDKVLVLTCSTESLYDRLKARGYPKNKIDENMECEIMRVCADEAREVFRGQGVVEEFVNDTENDQKNILTELQKFY